MNPANPLISKLEETAPWRTFSIFISSTFADMQAERDYLKQFVFPKVEEELQKRRIKLRVVDLRWGVDTTSMLQEDEREASVLKVCLDEIKHCRPFFIGLLGDRYGWIPPEERVKNATAGEDLRLSLKGKSVTALEIEFGVLLCKEQLSRSMFYFREPLPYHEFSTKVAAMFSDAFNPGFSDVEKQERKAAIDNLKNAIKEHYRHKRQPQKVKTYNTTWDYSANKVTGLETWATQVYEDILEECKSQAETTWDQVPQNRQEQELALLDAFIEDNTEVFCGREELLDEIKQHLLSENKDKWGMVLTGESGSGKSAVFAKVKKIMDGENCFILAHSAGLSPGSKNVLNLLLIWNNLLCRQLGIKEEIEVLSDADEKVTMGMEVWNESTLKTEIEKTQERFLELLFAVARQHRVVLLLDALDRFEPTERAQYMTWLPTVMPVNVKMLCTTIAGAEEKILKYHSGLFTKSIEHFSDKEAREMLSVLCHKQSKKLSYEVEKTILEKRRADGLPATSSPLWLSLAVNMLMAIDHDDFEKMRNIEGRDDLQIETYIINLAIAFNPLSGPLFLSMVDKAAQVFGPGFTHAVFNYLSCSRYGLREKDLEKLLPLQKIKWEPLQFANLRRWFKVHLVLQGEDQQWNLVHSILRNTLLENQGIADLQELHNSIAEHLASLPGNDSLQISETMYHLMQSDNKEMAAMWYGSFWANKPQTEGSSKVFAEVIISDEAQSISKSLDWVISLLEHGDNESIKTRIIPNNLLFSLCNKYLQNNASINTCIRLIEATEVKMEGMPLHSPEICEYTRDLSLVYAKMGELYLKLGYIPKALEKYQASHTITETLLRLDIDSVEYAHDFLVSYINLGDLHFKLGDLPKALEEYQASQNIAEEMYHRVPNSVNYVRALSVSYSRLGDMYFKLGDLDKALEKYQASHDITVELYHRAPKNANTAHDLAVSYQNLGNLHLKLGQLPNALEKYHSLRDLAQELYRLSPNNSDCAIGLSVAYFKLGNLYFKLGNLPEALEEYQASYNLAEEIYHREPDSTDHASLFSLSCSRLGDLYNKVGDLHKALEKYQTSRGIDKELYQRISESMDYASNLSISYEKLGDQYLVLGELPKALEEYQASLNIREEMHRRDPDSSDYLLSLSVSYVKLGNIYANLKDPAKALDKFQKSLKIAEELNLHAPDSAEYVRNLVVIYYGIIRFYSSPLNLTELMKYAKLCKEAMLYMKNKNMFLDESLLDILKWLERLIK